DAPELVLGRRVGADGRTRAYLAGRTVAVGELRAIGGALLAFYGQHEHRKLTLAAAQLEILDGLCGPEHAAALSACAHEHEAVRRAEERLQELRGLAGLAGRPRALLIESEDLAGELRDYGDRAAGLALEGVPAELTGEGGSLEALEERIAALERLARKHGGSVGAVLEYAQRARAR